VGQEDKFRIVVEAVAGDYRVERTVFAVVSELRAGDVENHAVSVSCGRKTNSTSASMNFLISHAQAIRSTFAFSRVTHLMTAAALEDRLMIQLLYKILQL
jgi:hypothetical protein